METNQNTQEVARRQGGNKFIIIGTLKKIDASEISKDGQKAISLTLTVTSKVGDKVHENKIQLYAKENSKLYKGYITVKNEYKEGKDRVSIECSLEKSIFKSNDGEIVENRRLRGIFCNRVEDEAVKDQVGGILECVPISITDEIKSNGPTGRKIVKAAYPGYNNSVHMFDLVLQQDLAMDFARIYTIGCTAELVINVNRYVVIDEEKVKAQSAPLFFGQSLDTMPDASVESWVNELVIVGGRQPKLQGNGAYTQEEIIEMQRAHELTIEKLRSQNNMPPQNTQPTAFGYDPYANQNMSTPMADNDMPF